MAVIQIAAIELQREYAALTGEGFLAGSGRLYGLERICWSLLDQLIGPSKAVAFALASLFELLARRQDGEPVTAEEGQRFYDIFDQPIRACIDFLRGNDDHADPMALMASLAGAYGRLRSLS